MKITLLILTVLLLQACKHPLAIEGEGDIIERLSGARGCTLEEFNGNSPRCTENAVLDGAYTVSYQALPRAGYRFARWEGTGCANLSAEYYCEYDVGGAWVGFTNLTWPGIAMPATTAVFLPESQYLFEKTVASAIIGERCVNCHVEGGAAGNTRMIYQRGDGPGVVANNYAVLSDFLATAPDIPDLILSKVRGVSHGGGVQVPAGSQEFEDLSQFLAGAADCADCGSGEVGEFFAGVELASPRATLRRAALILAGRLPTAAELESVSGAGEEQLRGAVLKLMRGDGFHQFLLRGANDRLLTDAFFGGAAGVDLRPANSAHAQYPEIANAAYEATGGDLSQPSSEAYQRRFQEMYYGMARAPLKLIAYVVENNRPYTEILTADYTLQNPALAEVYRSGLTFESDDFREFKPGPNRGQILQDEQLTIIEGSSGATLVTGHSGFVDYPITGLLNTSAFLSRYPTTETNRNRARSRWTYYHFLGLDIEKSSGRTTDPAALADRDNPTLKNPACIACHLVMDPVAGAYQDYGIDSYYLESWGGKDSLPELYKYAEPEIEGSSQPIDIVIADGAFDTFSVAEEVNAGVQAITIQYTNPASSASEDLPRGAAIESVRILLDGNEIFSSDGLSLLSIEGATNSGAIDFNGALAIYQQGAFVSFPVTFATGGQAIVELVAGGNTLADGIAPQVRVGVNAPPLVSPYIEGDRWFRDMLAPGIGDQVAPQQGDSLRWLAEHIADDPRFATATVRFWWPALMKAEALNAPAATSDRYYLERLNAFEVQSADIASMAEEFRGAYKLKQLLADMVLSPWFRAQRSSAPLDESRSAGLASLGMGALLSPEELNAKVKALAGFYWGEWPDPEDTRPSENPYWSELGDRLTGLYGGIDSFTSTKRVREINSLMANITQRQANIMACPVVVLDFAQRAADRRLFTAVERTTTPGSEFTESFLVRRDSYNRRIAYGTDQEVLAGDKQLVLQFDNSAWDENLQLGTNLRLDLLRIKDAAGKPVLEIELEDVLGIAGASISEPEWGPDGDVGWNEATNEQDHFMIWGWQGQLTIPVTLPADGTYRFEVVGWGEQVETLEVPRMSMTLNSPGTTGSRGATAIREQLQQLHLQLLGEDLALDSPELDHSYALLVDLWQARSELGNSQALDWEAETCDILVEGWWEQDRGAEFADPGFMLSTWSDMLIYFLTDYRFLHE